jgi:hypothetical protein
MALFAEDKVVFRVDLRDDSAVGELIGLRVARQFQIYELVEIGAAGHSCTLMDWPPRRKPLRNPYFSRPRRAWRTAGSSGAA